MFKLRWLTVIALAAACAPTSDRPQTAEELAESLRSLAAAGDAQAISALVQWAGVEGRMRESLEGMLTQLTEYDVAGVTVEPLREGQGAPRVRDGIEYSPSIELRGNLQVRFGESQPQAYSTLSIPFGSDDEGFWIAGMREKAVGGG